MNEHKHFVYCGFAHITFGSWPLHKAVEYGKTYRDKGRSCLLVLGSLRGRITNGVSTTQQTPLTVGDLVLHDCYNSGAMHNPAAMHAIRNITVVSSVSVIQFKQNHHLHMTNATKRLHKFRNRSHFSRDAKRIYEKTYYSHASSVVSTVTPGGKTCTSQLIETAFLVLDWNSLRDITLCKQGIRQSRCSNLYDTSKTPKSTS
ncbi:hypothetical protein CLF_111088 [Clonorchis sinensis]|uniref:Uncharacterized protein n=1 Tax=Clonorchis sinensis TaxID=79923 RepID=G7YUB9_CLOSI|nr:hypothetical protein CLF_111088 [Clonorchis sinensis]